MSGEGFTLEDFVEQLSMLRKLGPLKNILGMMPGASKNKELLDKVNDKDLDRAEAIVRSMTPEERRNPKIINGSRRLRIANGSGVTVGEVSQLVTNFFEGQKQMKMLMGGGHAGHAGHPRHGRRGPPLGQGGQGGQEREGQAAQRRPAQVRRSARRPVPATATARGRARAARRRAQDAPQSMEELAEMLQQAQSGGGPAGFGGAGGEGGFPGFGNPANVPQFPGRRLERHPGRLRQAQQEEEVERQFRQASQSGHVNHSLTSRSPELRQRVNT